MPQKVLNLRIQVGYSDSGLKPTAQGHESKSAFKSAFVEEFESKVTQGTLDDWATALDPSALPPSASQTEVTTFLTQQLGQRGLAAEQLAVNVLSHTGCENTPNGWRKTRSFSLRTKSTDWTLANVVQRYENAGNPIADEQAKQQLQQTDLLARVSWEVTT